MALTGLEYVFLALLTTLTGLVSAYIVYRVIRINLKRTINGFIPAFSKVIRSEMGNFVEEGLKDVDLGALAGQLGGAEGETGGLGDIAGMLGGGSGGLDTIMKLMQLFGGKGTNKGGKMGL